jgi:hypothetical protein
MVGKGAYDVVVMGTIALDLIARPSNATRTPALMPIRTWYGQNGPNALQHVAKGHSNEPDPVITAEPSAENTSSLSHETVSIKNHVVLGNYGVHGTDVL